MSDGKELPITSENEVVASGRLFVWNVLWLDPLNVVRKVMHATEATRTTIDAMRFLKSIFGRKAMELSLPSKAVSSSG